MKNLKALFLLLPLVFGSCVKPLYLTINYSDDENAKGKINILPSRSLMGASLTMNGKLLVEQKYIKKITVQNLPDGVYDYHLTCENFKLEEKVDEQNQCLVKDGNEQYFLVESPPYSQGYWIYRGLGTLGAFILWALLDWEN